MTEDAETQSTEEKTEETVASEEKKDTAEEKEPEKTTVYYVTDEVQQSQYINMFREAGKDAVILKHNIDSAFISSLEQKNQEVQFKRIDADLTEETEGRRNHRRRNSKSTDRTLPQEPCIKTNWKYMLRI